MDKNIEKVVFFVPKQPKMKRVAAYARVSSGKDAMLHSLSAQVSRYSEMIQTHPGWLYAGVYADEAKTGTKDSREGFRALLNDCRAGKIDIVITKSIARFSRNTVILLEAVRELRALGVDVFFEEQNIHSISAEGEMMLTILAVLAQEEAMSVSNNQKWRVRKNFREGRPWNTTMLGYRNENGILTVVPEEAAVVRKIYAMFLDGMGAQAISNQLNEEGFKTRFGNPFSYTGIRRILRNYAYTGNLLLQKTYSEDGITKRRRVNLGELPMYHAEGTHEAIITADDFSRVQEEMKRRAEKFTPKHQGKAEYPFSSLITCAKCGKRFIRKKTKGGPVWICPTFNRVGKAACPSKQIPEAVLLKLTEDIDLRRVAGITAYDGNRLVFDFENGGSAERLWLDRSRSESWSDEKKKKASEKTKARYAK